MISYFPPIPQSVQYGGCSPAAAPGGDCPSYILWHWGSWHGTGLGGHIRFHNLLLLGTSDLHHTSNLSCCQCKCVLLCCMHCALEIRFLGLASTVISTEHFYSRPRVPQLVVMRLQLNRTKTYLLASVLLAL